MIDAVAGTVGATLLLSGLGMATIGLYGLLRRRDIFEQLHAAGLVTGPGVILVLLASLATGNGEIITSAVLVIAFVLITSSLSTHAIALASWRRKEQTQVGRNRGVHMTAGEASYAFRVLVAHDGSEGAQAAVDSIVGLPWPPNSLVRLVVVDEGGLPPLAAAGAASESDVDVTLALDAAEAVLRDKGISVDRVLRSGEPATAIAKEAERFDADLVVVGSRGLGRLRAMLVGSVAAEVVDRAPCPVLVARTPAVDRPVLATDGSDASLGATELMAACEIFASATIRVLTVATDMARYPEDPLAREVREAGERARQQPIADAAALRLRAAGRSAVPTVLNGDAAARILAFAKAEEANLIVLGSRGRTGLTRALLGSVAREVLWSAEASVLIVPVLPRGKTRSRR